MSTEQRSSPRTDIVASFLVTDYDCDHSSISAALGVSPTDTWEPGDIIAKTKRIRKERGWRIRSILPADQTVSAHASSLLRQLRPDYERLDSIGIYQAWLSFAVRMYGLDRPPLLLDSALLGQLAKLKASIDIDLYNFD